MAPVARGQSSQPPPADSPQGRLEEAVNVRYEPIQRFFEEVARRSGREPASEKSAFYRYTRRSGAVAGWRLDIYAELAQIDREAIAPDTTPLSRNDEIRALREELGEVRGMLAELLARPAGPAVAPAARKGRQRSA